ncbi:acyltransferase [Prevotella koreensis]|uniref:acyltransferase n=1 Tax=Prevotella koreensis TaxID=2490854 RepID=UPI0028E1AF0D|nr:acyltransferase [Prevotella koreensis]
MVKRTNKDNVIYNKLIMIRSSLFGKIFLILGFSFKSWVSFIYYNYFCNKIITDSNLPILLYKNCIFELKKNSKLKISSNVQIGYKELAKSKTQTRIKVMEGGTIDFRSHFIVYEGGYIYVGNNARLILGSGFVNENVQIICRQHIKIGDGATIGPDVVIRDSDEHCISGKENKKPIVIGNKVWIGQGAVILKGVNIGEGSVIGTKSVVTHDIPKNCLVAGNPARVIKENIFWS